ncbi:MAG: hypothetical protein QOG13_1633 [Sphingomonadales bacterium]|jgi:hypothetical protein|nr:hypothetical protein [Sphingomonadales bacterium]
MDDPHPLPPRLLAILQDMPLAELAFTPVPVRARHDGWSPARQIAFIQRLALCGSVATAARAVGVTRKSAYRLRERPGAESFASAWDNALAMGQCGRVDHAIERAVAGEVRPVFYRGRKCGEYVRHSTGLTLAVLKLMARQRPGGERWGPVARDPWDY